MSKPHSQHIPDRETEKKNPVVPPEGRKGKKKGARVIDLRKPTEMHPRSPYFLASAL